MRVPSKFPGKGRYPHDEVGFGAGVGDAVVGIFLSQMEFQVLVLAGSLGVADEVIPKKKTLPVFEVGFDHVDMMSPPAGGIPLNEPGVKGRDIIPPGGPPEVIIP